MPRLLNLELTKTYATRENAIKAVNKKLSHQGYDNLRYIVYVDPASGRFFPVFIGQECLQAGIHFHFHVVC